MSSVTLLPSTTVFRKYKNYSTYKGKVVQVDGSSIKSTVLETEHKTKEEAKAEAEQWIMDRKREKINDN